MKIAAAVMFEQGLPRPFAVSRPLRLETVDLEGPGDGEVLVEIAGAGLCHSDLSAIEGNRPRAVPTVVPPAAEYFSAATAVPAVRMAW